VTAGTLVQLQLDLDGKTETATLNISGPAFKWFGVGFGAPNLAMSDRPYAVIVHGTLNVVERQLGNHVQGQILSNSITVISNRLVDNVRTVVMKRPFKGLTADHYTFDPWNSSTINVIMASGKDGSLGRFGYHGPTRGGEAIQLTAIDAPTC